MAVGFQQFDDDGIRGKFRAGSEKYSRKRWFSPEHREKLSKARKGQKPTLGKHYSASTRKNQRRNQDDRILCIAELERQLATETNETRKSELVSEINEWQRSRPREKRDARTFER